MFVLGDARCKAFAQLYTDAAVSLGMDLALCKMLLA